MSRPIVIALLASLSAASIVNIGDKPMQPLNGRVCAIADMNKDGYTDLILQHNNQLEVYLQSTDGSEFRDAKMAIALDASAGDVHCSVGDFNGDTCPDILVVEPYSEQQDFIDKIKAVFSSPDPRYKIRVYMNDGDNKFAELRVPACEDAEGSRCKFVDHPGVLDVNGDGVSDLFGFAIKPKTSESDQLTTELFCLAGQRLDSAHFRFTPCEHRFPALKANIHAGFAPIFADFVGELSANIAFLQEDLRLVVLQRDSSDPEQLRWQENEELSVQLPPHGADELLASPLVADVDSDGRMDILIPICASGGCSAISKLWCYSNGKFHAITVDLKQAVIHPEIDGKTQLLFRIGDFSQNGYPDLIGTMTPTGGTKGPFVLDNVFDADNQNFTRKFELSKTPQRILPPLQDQLSGIVLSAFFDLKEDGNLDMMLEYNAASGTGPQVNFVRCDDKGDTTFLKVQVFTSPECEHKACCEVAKDSTTRSIKIGSGIVWHGACVAIQMTDTDAKSGMRFAKQCQLPQTAHRTLHNPFVLFGLSRSPNFIDEVHFGGPRAPGEGKFQQDFIKQVVPNSRVIVIPPDERGQHWTSRLFVTPSQLIYLSLLVMVSMCGFLLLLIAFLHLRERQQDKKERQAQTHRFHFDAM